MSSYLTLTRQAEPIHSEASTLWFRIQS